MISHPNIVESFEQEFLREENLTLDQRFQLIEAMYDLAQSFGHFRSTPNSSGSTDPIHIQEHKIQLAEALNRIVPKTP